MSYFQLFATNLNSGKDGGLLKLTIYNFTE